MFDLARKYRIERGESIEYADTLGDARYTAGVWQASEDARPVLIVRQLGIPRRWSAALQPSGAVRLDELFSDGIADVILASDGGKQARLASLIDRENQRRQDRRTPRALAREAELNRRAAWFGGKCVVCTSLIPPRKFPSIRNAARWAGVEWQSLQRALAKKPRPGRKPPTCAGFTWAWAKDLKGEGANGQKPARQARS